MYDNDGFLSVCYLHNVGLLYNLGRNLNLLIELINSIPLPNKYSGDEQDHVIYCSIDFPNRTESRKLIEYFLKCIKCENTSMANEARSLQNAPTQNRLPDSRLPANSGSATIISFAFLVT
jgi:hypothetical protein